MSAYLGKLGQLVPIYTTPGMSVTGIPERTYEKSLEGRVTAQVKPKGAREWSLDAAFAEPEDVGTLMSFVLGEWGIGPFVWVSPTAPGTNMLTPDVSLCGKSAILGVAVEQAGPLTLPDGVAGRSLINGTPANPLYFGAAIVPVIPSEPVTASAYLVGAGSRMAVAFYDAAGGFISTTTGPVGGVAGSAKRLSVTALTPPSNAASCVPLGLSATYGARPAVTWSSQLLSWQTGEGCPAAIVDATDRTSRFASTHVGGLRSSDLSFTIKEVGN